MEKGLRRLDHILPTEQGKDKDWIVRKGILERGNEYETNVVQSVVGERKLSAFSDGLGRTLCQCMSSGNTIGGGSVSEGIGGKISNFVVSTCACGGDVYWRRNLGLRVVSRKYEG